MTPEHKWTLKSDDTTTLMDIKDTLKNGQNRINQDDVT